MRLAKHPLQGKTVYYQESLDGDYCIGICWGVYADYWFVITNIETTSKPIYLPIGSVFISEAEEKDQINVNTLFDKEKNVIELNKFRKGR